MLYHPITRRGHNCGADFDQYLWETAWLSNTTGTTHAGERMGISSAAFCRGKVAMAEKESLLANFNGNRPVDETAIQQFEVASGFRLPSEYAQFLHKANGGEGFIGNTYVVFWKIDESLEMNMSYQTIEYAPELFLFGSDGGGEAFAFDSRFETKPIVSVPFVGMDLDLAIPMAPTFDEFLEKLFNASR